MMIRLCSKRRRDDDNDEVDRQSRKRPQTNAGWTKWHVKRLASSPWMVSRLAQSQALHEFINSIDNTYPIYRLIHRVLHPHDSFLTLIIRHITPQRILRYLCHHSINQLSTMEMCQLVEQLFKQNYTLHAPRRYIINILPRSIVSMIYTYLTPIDITSRLVLVSRAFLHLYCHTSYWRLLDSYDFSQYPIPQSRIPLFVKTCRNLVHIHAHGIDSRNLRTIAQNCRNVQYLKLGPQSHNSTSSLDLAYCLSQWKMRLRQFHVHFINVSQIIWNALMMCRVLEELDLSDCAIEPMKPTQQNHREHELKILRLSGCHTMSNQTLVHILSQCTSIEELDLRYCTSLHGNRMVGAILTLLRIRILNVEGCALYNIQNLPESLEILRFSSAPHRHFISSSSSLACGLREIHCNDPVSIQNLILNNNMNTIRCIDLTSPFLVFRDMLPRDEHIHTVARTCPNIEKLQLHRSHHITDASFLYLSKCQHLHYIDVSECRRITDLGIELLVDHRQHLSSSLCTLILRMTSITDRSLTMIGSGKYKSLTYLNVQSCNVSDYGVLELFKHQHHIHQLEHLNISHTLISVWGWIYAQSKLRSSTSKVIYRL